MIVVLKKGQKLTKEDFEKAREEKRRIKLNCLTDFQRATVLFSTNLQTDSYRVFFDHGVKLLGKLSLSGLIENSKNIERMIVNKDTVKYISDKILMLGILASQGEALRS